MRLFVALSLPANIIENLTSLLGELRHMDSKPRWVNPANLHVTLKFIGELPAEKLPSVTDALAGVHAPRPLSLHVHGVGFFPNDRRPTVVWAGIEAAPDLAALAGQIDQAIHSSCGVPRETRPFAAHLTLARLKEPRISPALRENLEKSKERSFGRFSAGEFHLIESKLKSSGAEYTTLHSFRFAAEGNDR